MNSDIVQGTITWWNDVKKIPKDYRNWKNLTPEGKMNAFINFSNCFCKTIGCYVYDKCQFNFYSYFGSLLMGSYFVLAIYTIIKNILDADLARAANCLSFSGVFISTFVAYCIAVFKYRFKSHELYFTYKKIYTDEDKSIKHNEIRENSIEYTIEQSKLMVKIIFASVLAGVANPLYVYYRDGVLYYLTGTDTPFCERGSKAEAYFNITFSIITALGGAAALCVMQTSSALICNIISVTTDLILLELDEFSDLLEQNHLSQIEIKMRVKRVILQILRTDKFIRDYWAIFYWYFFISPYVLTYAVALSIYAQYVLDFPCGYGIAIMSYVQLLIFTTMGQATNDRRDLLCDGLYAFKWYLLSDDLLRRRVCFLLSEAQNGAVFTIGPFEVLNLETAKILTGRIHSFIMLLLSFQ